MRSRSHGHCAWSEPIQLALPTLKKQHSPKKGFATPPRTPFHQTMFELNGTVKKIFEEKTFGSGFNVREFVVTTEADKYPQDICFQCVKEKVELVGKLKEGDKVKVGFDLRGREYQGKYFVNLNAWKIDYAAGAGAAAASDEPPPYDQADEILDEEPPF